MREQTTASLIASNLLCFTGCGFLLITSFVMKKEREGGRKSMHMWEVKGARLNIAAHARDCASGTRDEGVTRFLIRQV